MGLDNDLELLPCSFQFHNFQDKVGEVNLICQITKMKQSFYVWLAEYNDQSLKHLAVASTVAGDGKKQVLSTKILGPIVDDTSSFIASRLSAKVGVPVFVSFNVMTDNLSLPAIEKRIAQEFNNHPELLVF
ncbi:uncharacterized protein LOC106660510 [Trichogramma pretiosum]|uniref:uncharacterized protein LOC106660510 n=1 Tax=Trichogramma pretiosum TaxID=7493 RepID=UPI0006C95CE7|nr:uncharacterized protein LOC106660510 [Trichogramma pretiosum]